MNNKYVISSIADKDFGCEDYDETLYWSNENGWVDLSDSTVFNQLERDSFTLPIGNNVLWELLPNTLSYTEHNIIRNALMALKVLALSAGDDYLDELSVRALEIFE